MAAKRVVYKLSPGLSHMLGKSELTRPAAIKELYVVAESSQLLWCSHLQLPCQFVQSQAHPFWSWQLGLREAARTAGPERRTDDPFQPRDEVGVSSRPDWFDASHGAHL